MSGARLDDHVFGMDEVGSLRYRERHRPGPIALAVLFLAPLLVPLIFRDDVTSVAIFLVYYLVALGFLVLLYMSGWMNRISVYDRAVVLDHSWPGGNPYVIPLSTIDPDRVRYHRRANLIGRRLGQGRRTLRVAPYASQAITFQGLSPRVAVRRPGRPAEGIDRVLPDSRWMEVDDGTRRVRLELATWVVSTRTARRLLRALEDALVTAGRPDAAGLADRRFAHPVVERWRQPLTDAEIYADRG